MIALLLLAFQDLTAEKAADAVVVKSAGKELLRYQLTKPADSKLASDSACYFHPLSTPKGTVITDVAPDDHKHHRGIFLAWVEMHGKKDADFWGWGQYAPKDKRQIVNRDVTDLKGGAFRVRNDWKADGETILVEDLAASVKVEGAATVLDLAYTLTADAELKISKWAFSGFCLRMRKDGKARVEGPEGEVKLPAPNHMKPETDWPSQPWYAIQVALPDGTEFGGAVLSAASNPPTLWHNPVSIRMVNPCVVAPGDLVLKAGEPRILRYKVVAWDGPLPKELLKGLVPEK